MKIVQFNAVETGGGAANACQRLTEALITSGADVTFLAQKQKGMPRAYNRYLINNLYKKLHYGIRHVRNRSYLKEYAYTAGNFSVTLHGADVANHPAVKNSDIVHLHWINDSFVSPCGIADLLKAGKKLVWTLHDMRPFTGGCHYSGTCRRFEASCGLCPELNSNKEADISRKQNLVQQELLGQADIKIVTPSRWMAREAAKSSLFKNNQILAIPNALDTDVYKPLDKKSIKAKYGIAQDKKVLLFGAVASLHDERKGFKYLLQALELIARQKPELKEQIALVVFGSDNEYKLNLPFSIHLLGKLYTDAELVEAYNLSDVFITPSLQDNLPTTIMEAMACEVPVVGFDIGGIPEMIDHKVNGYVAKPLDPSDLACGILWVLEQNGEELNKHARRKVEDTYAYPIIGEQHLELYTKI